MRVILIFLAALLLLGTASAYLEPQYDTNVLYTNGSPLLFLVSIPSNAIPYENPVKLSGTRGDIFFNETLNPSIKNDGDIGKKFARLIDGQDFQWYPNLTIP